jgi:hypothetical protein
VSLSTGDNPQFGQVATSTTPAQLPSQVCSVALLQNDPGSSTNILIGGSGAQHFVLTPGTSISIPCSNLNQIYVVAASSTPNLNWITAS